MTIYYIIIAALVIGVIFGGYYLAFRNAPERSRADDTPGFNRVLDEMERRK